MFNSVIDFSNLFVINTTCRRLLSQTALEKLNLQVAELAFVKCKDYAGVQFVKRVAHIKVCGCDILLMSS